MDESIIYYFLNANNCFKKFSLKCQPDVFGGVLPTELMAISFHSLVDLRAQVILSELVINLQPLAVQLILIGSVIIASDHLLLYLTRKYI